MLNVLTNKHLVFLEKLGHKNVGWLILIGILTNSSTVSKKW